MILLVNTGAQSPAASFVTSLTDNVPLIPPVFVFGDQLPIDLLLVDGRGNYDPRGGDAANSIRFGLGPIGGPLLAYQAVWSAILNGFHAEVNFNTTEGAAFLAGQEMRKTWLEVELSEPGPLRQTIVHTEVEFRQEIIPNTPTVPAPIEDYLTTAEINKSFVQNRFSVSGLTGGGSSNLDGIVTLGAVDTGTMVAVVISGTVYFYQLQNSTAAENSPLVIRPDDYANPGNTRVWQLVSPLSATQFTGFTHNQSTPAPVWIVAHNMGYRPSGISVWISHLGSEKLLAGAEIVHIDNNSFQVRHRLDQSGIVRCI